MHVIEGSEMAGGIRHILFFLQEVMFKIWHLWASMRRAGKPTVEAPARSKFPDVSEPKTKSGRNSEGTHCIHTILILSTNASCRRADVGSAPKLKVDVTFRVSWRVFIWMLYIILMSPTRIGNNAFSSMYTFLCVFPNLPNFPMHSSRSNFNYDTLIDSVLDLNTLNIFDAWHIIYVYIITCFNQFSRLLRLERYVNQFIYHIERQFTKMFRARVKFF